MTKFRTSPCLTQGLFALVAACALTGPIFADPAPSHDYPPTYSSRKGAWFDPLGLLNSSEKKSAAANTPIERMPIPSPSGPLVAINGPAWKWYGYGTPTPGQNQISPNVPGNWYSSSGATAGAIPHAQAGAAIPGVVPDPNPNSRSADLRRFRPNESLVLPSDGPALPGAVADVNWQSVPARLRVPTKEHVVSVDGPHATLKAPIPVDEPTPAIRPSVPAGPAIPVPTAESSDLPIEAAPGIVPPQVSRINRPITARGSAPESAIGEAIQRACGSNFRVLEVAEVGPKRLIVRLAGNAVTAREQIARLPQLAGWHIEIERVTVLAK